MSTKQLELKNMLYLFKKACENLNSDLIPYFKNGSKIEIKKKNKGKFTASAKKVGKSVQQYAQDVLSNPKSTTLQKKRANFARNAAKWKH